MTKRCLNYYKDVTNKRYFIGRRSASRTQRRGAIAITRVINAHNSRPPTPAEKRTSVPRPRAEN